MTLLRKSTLNQLKRINSDIKKQGGKTDMESPSEKNLPNGMWINNPLDRKITTYEEFASIDISENTNEAKKELSVFQKHQKTIALKTLKMNDVGASMMGGMTKGEAKNFLKSIGYTDEHITRLSGEIVNTDKVYKLDEKKTEKSEEKSPIEINREIKNIRNWTEFQNNPNPKKERDILTAGKYVEVGDIKGYINRIEGSNVIIEDLSGEEDRMKTISLSKLLKAYKVTKEKDIVSDISMVGPNNKSVSEKPKEVKSFSDELNGKGTKMSDQKLSDEIHKEKTIKKFSDLSAEFDGSKMSGDKNTIIIKTVKDQKISDKNNTEKEIKKFSDLTADIDTSKMSKDKITIKKSVMGDQKITDNNTDVKIVKKLGDISLDLDVKKLKSDNISFPAKQMKDQKISDKNNTEKVIKTK